jgi:hypothetical protein
MTGAVLEMLRNARNQSGVDAALSVLQARGVTLTSTLVVFERLMMGVLPATEATYQALPSALKERSAVGQRL